MIEVELFVPCFIDQVYPQIGFNTIKILEKVGCKVHYNPNQTCCGQPAYNAGYFKEAEEISRKFINDFPYSERYIVMPSASCAGMVRNAYEDLLTEEFYRKRHQDIQNQTFELTEFLVDVLGIEKIEGAKLSGVATYHDSCSALRECIIKEAPRQLLANVEGLSLVEMKDNEVCCGFGGTFAVKFPSISSAMAEQKVDNALAASAEIIISTDYSCLMHMEGYIQKQGKPLRVMHIADVLASGWE